MGRSAAVFAGAAGAGFVGGAKFEVQAVAVAVAQFAKRNPGKIKTRAAKGQTAAHRDAAQTVDGGAGLIARPQRAGDPIE